MKKITVFIFLALAVGACKKSRTCECKNSNGAYDAGDTDGYKWQAKKYCKSLSDGQTECYLKN